MSLQSYIFFFTGLCSAAFSVDQVRAICMSENMVHLRFSTTHDATTHTN
ncbi:MULTISPECIES: hypothetical protein [unclassified Imperialibacter]|nr:MULTISPECIES: hypothetical protein [unclassified Imperialibacter]